MGLPSCAPAPPASTTPNTTTAATATLLTRFRSTELAPNPTANVTSAPISTYQVHATCGSTFPGNCHSARFTPNPVTIPTIAPPCVAYFVKVPSRNTPSKHPYATLAIDSPISTTFPLPPACTAYTATANSTSAHITVDALDTITRSRSSAPGRHPI